jgi:UBX domain-containing protein 1
MADDASVSQFLEITGADPGSAAAFLALTNGDVEAAVSTYFESGGVLEAVPGAAAAPDVPAVAPGPSVVSASSSAPASRPARRAAPQPPHAAPGGVATLASLAAGRNDSDDDESGRNYYAGGEKSGQMIQDPRGRGRRGTGSGPGTAGDGNPADPRGRDVSDAIFERARQRGPLSDAERDEFQDRQSFTGAGYRLGDAATADVPVTRPDVVGRRNVTRVLTFYQNGFTVDEGPLRAMDDPANAAFLRDIERGFVPKEMEQPDIGNVSIHLIDMKDEQYVPPKPIVVPFAGSGNRLGASSSTPLATETSSTPDVNAARAAVPVDENLPVASIQVRLSDGTRVVARLNENHTVQNLRDFVAASRPSITSFTLGTAFPRKVLTDNAQSIKEANLNGAVVVQSLT